MPAPDSLKKIIKSLPAKPGVYQYFNEEGTIIYVGKAKNLKKRVSSYFTKTQQYGKVRRLVSQIRDIHYLVTETEIDALLLENNLIKKYKPKYNVMWKDDKTFPWICIKNERFPRVFPTRQRIEDGSEYYGPFGSVRMMHTLLELIRELFQVRTCKYNLSEENIQRGKFSVCLEYHIGKCLGPCEGKQSETDYTARLEEIRNIIKGRVSDVIGHARQTMNDLAANMQFEYAQEMKEKIELLERYQVRSTVVSQHVHNVDVYSIVTDKDAAFVNFLKVMSGCIVQGYTLEMKKELDESPKELLEIAVVELRDRFKSESPAAILPFHLDIDEQYFEQVIPQRGDKRKLLEMSERNAKAVMQDKRRQIRFTDPERHSTRIMEQIKSDLKLADLPQHIECFDNSNIQGSNPVAACVVFRKAKPSKKEYRHFNIKTVTGPDDFASMREVVHRRYSRMLQEGEPMPQLIVIDGGKGQLSAALDSLEALGLRGKVAIIGIAKKLEEIYFPGDSIPLYIDKRSETLKVIQHLRNEAHRFGITHHRNRRSKGAIGSELTTIKGIGDETARQLYRHFGSVKRIKSASIEELEQVVTPGRARLIHTHFAKNA